jgi:pyruvate ferredoxin oxidoreductase gamma subunit
MSQLTEIRWHARAGQGAVTAAKLVADTALLQGNFIQACPEYGPERTGAPLKAYTRVSDEPIQVRNNILNPDVVIVMDDTLLSSIDVIEGIKEDGIIILNTRMTADEARAAVKAPASVKVFVLDATGIALATIGKDMPNTPLVGALAKVTGMFPAELVKQRFELTNGKKFSRDMIERNFASVDRAYEEVHD